VRTALPAEPQLTFDGPVDTVTDDELVDEVTAVVREALANVARHAEATSVELRVRARDGLVSVAVRDDGRGIGHATRRSGLDNLRRRAEERNGTLATRAGSAGTGTVLEWAVPHS
jgi:signal transduction histidine kinase